jgi:mannose-6-phosphate isomerase-like protein (cupin superfamily)
MKRAPLPHCHGGVGSLDFTVVLDGKESPLQHVRFIHDDMLAPGVSIGVHQHRDEEHYYILSGRGTMALDGQRYEVGPGDIASVYAGGSHGLENTGHEDMRILVVAAG